MNDIFDRKTLLATRKLLLKRLAIVDAALRAGASDEVDEAADQPNGRRPRRRKVRRGRPKAGTLEGEGLRPAIRRVLAGQTVAMSPRDVTTHLQSTPVDDPHARTPLGTRVRNDMFRMFKAEQLRRIGHGKYKLAE